MNFNQITSNPFYFKLFLLRKLPMAFLAGLRLQKVDNTSAEIILPFRWLNTNPFKSMYFACLAMASELSTGILVMKKVADTQVPISMLVIDMKGAFIKRGLENVLFKCEDGHTIDEAVAKALATGEGQTIHLTSKGYDSKGEVLCQFEYQWSIKVRKTQ